MSRTRLGRAAIVSLTLGTVTVACNPGGGSHVASAGDRPARADAFGARLADKARAALARRDAARSVRYAEGAVLAAPRNAANRALLGQAYLAGGRFASAETSLRESLSIAPEQPRARFDLALAEIAEGRADAAREALGTLNGKVADGDLGLAFALAGDRAKAIALLSDLVRSGKSDARSRQNLALAYALDGRWREARAMAMQDMTPDQVNDRMASWAGLAGANDARAQIAALLGTTPAAADPGRPAILALATPAAPVALAAAAMPTPIAATPDPIASAPAPALSPIPEPAARPAVAAPIVPSAAVPAAFAAAAMPGEASRAVAMPTMLAAPRVAPVSLVRVDRSPRIAPGPLLHPVARGGFVVQLGAFSRPRALETAWTRASRLSPRIATLSAVSGRTSVSGATLVRLSIGGFGDRAHAASLCRQIQARGGACFVRSLGNDTPWQWAGREGAGQLAMADGRAGA